jgi:16S rRNA (adenine1518-N6/adenine1519-N6)-dimethyltransferase
MNLLSATLDLCKMYSINPDKEKGQNFLIEESVYDKIIEVSDLKSDDTVLEVGPGLGFLTFKLAKKTKKVLAVEVDPQLADFLDLNIKSKEIDNIELFRKDILKAKGESFSRLGPYKVVSNLPYNITSVFSRKFLSLKFKPSLMVLMLQKEVAERMVAQPPKMSLLSVSVQFYARAEIIQEVGRENFYPRPKVDSAIIKIIPDKKLLATYEEEKNFFRILKIAFSSKRKMLKNNLSSGLGMEMRKAEEMLEKSGLDLKIRAESLSIDDWLKLYNVLK